MKLSRGHLAARKSKPELHQEERSAFGRNTSTVPLVLMKKQTMTAVRLFTGSELSWGLIEK
ncbi:hypothetical protein PHMEG_0003431 [Phytophthora megakarya]|uniref:Uncharacterized protein n=1 Tax=Phytophthora megakarya TaxID=4795 RepID=A0A225WWK9_9STRA|nr:hypothetical protein PHMEG_0003431 [Phytophthora megakarya]